MHEIRGINTSPDFDGSIPNPNGFKELMDYFGSSAFSGPSRPCSLVEFKEFWISCSADDKTYFKSVPLYRL